MALMDAPAAADPYPTIAALIPRDADWERVVVSGLGPRMLPWQRVPRYRREAEAPEPTAIVR